jgi:hypothetical protein
VTLLRCVNAARLLQNDLPEVLWLKRPSLDLEMVPDLREYEYGNKQGVGYP